MEILAVCVPVKKAQVLRVELEKLQLWDKSRKLHKIDGHNIAIPVRCSRAELLELLVAWPDARVCNAILPPSKKSLFQIPFYKLKAAVTDLLKTHNLSESLLEELPQKWEKHGDLIIIPCNTFTSPQWHQLDADLWKTVANALSCKRIARHSPIAANGFRSSQVSMLLGDDGKVVHHDNGIKYSYDVTKCMFSIGNITEKMRVAQFDCRSQVVVDLFSGIGYFTLPYLVHAKAEHVHACEWNPDAIAALRKNLSINGVAERCTIHEGDNTKLRLADLADRVYLGLIPSSEESWPVAVRVLKPSGGFLHIHGNVTTDIPASSFSCGTTEHSDVKNSTVDDFEISSTSSQYIFKNQEEPLKQTLLTSMDIDCGSGEKCSKFCSSSNCLQHGNASGSTSLSPMTVWASEVASKIDKLLREMKGGEWSVLTLHVERVKSYAPHIDHVVVDLECKPLS